MSMMRLNNLKLKQMIYVIAQCTWGIIQTILGAILFVMYISNKHFIYHGSIVTKWKYHSSVSLGLFVFVAEAICFKKDKALLSCEESFNRLLVHEYGHTIQSLIFGPLYIVVIGIPSMLWGVCGVKKRLNNNVAYGSFFTEKWANALGETVTGMKSIEDIVF